MNINMTQIYIESIQVPRDEDWYDSLII